MPFDNVNLETIKGQVLLIDEKPARGKITFSTTVQLVDGKTGQTIFPVPMSVTLDAAGKFTIDLPATNDPDLSPIGWTYQVSVDVAGSQRRVFYLEVPIGTGPIDLFLSAASKSSPGVYIIRGPQGETGYFTGREVLITKGDVSGAVVCDLTIASAYSMTLIGNTVVTFIEAEASKVNYATLRVKQGGAGNFTLTIANAQGSFGVQPVLSATPGHVDKIACESWDGGAHWDVALTGQAIA